MPFASRSAVLGRLLLGSLILGLYAVPLFFPPPAAPLWLPPPGASLLQRLFPNVPGWWVAGRLLALAVGAWWITGAPRAPGETTTAPALSVIVNPERRLWLALVVATGMLLAAPFAEYMNRSTQIGFILMIPLPALLGLGTPAEPRTSGRGAGVLAIVAMPLIWAACAFPLAWRSTWMANIVDTLGPFSVLERTATDPTFNLLTGAFRQGITPLILIFQGAGLFDLFDFVPTFQTVQLANSLGMIGAGIGFGVLGGRLFGRDAAPVAAAALLFSPYAAVAPIFLAPMFLGFLIPAWMLLMLHSAHTRRSASALIALAALTAMPATNPTAALIAWTCFALGVWTARREPQIPLPAQGTAILLFLAIVIPGIPAALEIGELFNAYAVGRFNWATIEAMYLGQINPDLVRFGDTSGHFPPLDGLVGSLLAPFAIPRTAIRAWGDALIDPVGTILAAIALVAFLRGRARHLGPIVGLLVLALIPGFVTSYDRTSITRMALLPVPMALLAAAGFRWLVDHLRPAISKTQAGAIVAVAIASSGLGLTQFIQPRILPRSGIGIALDATSAKDAEESMILFPMGLDPQASAVYASRIPAVPLPFLAYQEPDQLRRHDGTPVARRLYWSPSTEEQRNVSRAVCRAWPATRLFTLYDQAHLSRTFVAAPGDAGWMPQLERNRWSESKCPSTLATESRDAAELARRARQLLRQARAGEAIQLLRTGAIRSIVQVGLLDLFARTLLLHGKDDAERDEAIFWAERAVSISSSCLHRPVSTLVAAYQRRGRGEEATLARRRARAMHDTVCAGLPDGHPWKTGKRI